MNTIALYQPPARWPIGLSLLAAITIETAAIGLAGLHRVEEIPFAGGISSPPIVADFIPDPADPAPPEATPPVMPPAPETPTEFSLVEPAAPLHPPSHATASLTRSSRPQTASFAAAGARLTNARCPLIRMKHDERIGPAAGFSCSASTTRAR